MKLLPFLRSLFNRHQDKVRDAVLLTQWLKNAIDSDVAMFIVDVIPSDKDNKWRDKKSKQLASVLKALKLIKGVGKIEPYEAKYILTHRNSWLPTIAAELLVDATNKKVNFDAAIDKTQKYYKENVV